MRAITERDVLSSLGQAIRKLRWTILHGEVERTGDSPVLIFICGANKPDGGGLSERRQAVIRFLETSIQNVSIVIAEHFFDALLNDINHQINLLDAEHFLTKISDDVIIILESQSAFCELGAFSHESLREKLLIINDEEFKTSPSFINIGPIAAIDSSNKRKNIFHYPMQPDGIMKTDGIGDTFYDLHQSIVSSKKNKTIKYEKENLIPDKGNDSSKEALMLASDIIYLCAPMTYKELCELYTSIFGKMSFNGLGKIIALLKGMKFIKYEKTHGYIESLTDSLFFSYGKHTEELIISFKLNRIKEEWRRK